MLHRRTGLFIPLSALVLLVLLLAVPAAATAAPPWPDAPSSWWESSYGVTDTEVATVADGYADGYFRPANPVTRGQFAKMAVNGLGLDTADPATATFKDVPGGSTFFIYVEGASAEGLIGGYPGGLFRPASNITRQQTNSILGKYLAQVELDNTMYIHGSVRNYGSLEEWYAAEGGFWLKMFDDWQAVSADHRPGTAYLAWRGVLKGSGTPRKANPLSTLTRAQAATLVLRTKETAVEMLTPPAAPANLGLTATGADASITKTGTGEYVGNDPTPQVTGDTLASRAITLYDSGAKLLQDTSNASGKFYVDLVNPLADGTHSLTAKVVNSRGVASDPSIAIGYVLDTAPPSGSITAPTPAEGKDYAALASPKPDFTVSATDVATGVFSVQFQVAINTSPLVWQTISTDLTPDTGTTTYAAIWPATGDLGGGLADGYYQFRAIVTDAAGNQTVLGPLNVIIDSTAPTVTITSPLPNGEQFGRPVFFTADRAPQFAVNAVDAGSGVARVDLYYAPWSDTPLDWSSFTHLATSQNEPYILADYGDLPDGDYVFAVRATDTLGNQSVLLSGGAYVAGVTEEVVIDTSPPAATGATGTDAGWTTGIDAGARPRPDIP